MECVKFSASCDYGHFRKPYTTTSTISFFSIHPVAVRGMIGAITGIDRKNLYDQTKNLRIGIKVLNPLIKVTQNLKLLTMKTNNGKNGLFNFPSNFEFIRNPNYEIYVFGDDKLINDLESRLKNHNPVFTPCMGISEFITKVRFIGKYKIEEYSGNEVYGLSPFNYETVNNNYDFFIDSIPVENNKNREYTKYIKSIMYFKDGISAQFKMNDYSNVFKIGDENVYFF